MRFRQATDQLQSPSWTRMVAVSSGRVRPGQPAVPSHMEQRSSHLTAHLAMARSCNGALPCAIGYLLKGHEKIREGYVQ